MYGNYSGIKASSECLYESGRSKHFYFDSVCIFTPSLDSYTELIHVGIVTFPEILTHLTSTLPVTLGISTHHNNCSFLQLGSFVLSENLSVSVKRAI